MLFDTKVNRSASPDESRVNTANVNRAGHLRVRNRTQSTNCVSICIETARCWTLRRSDHEWVNGSTRWVSNR